MITDVTLEKVVTKEDNGIPFNHESFCSFFTIFQNRAYFSNFRILGFSCFCPKITATKIAKRGKGGFLREIHEEGEKNVFKDFIQVE